MPKGDYRRGPSIFDHESDKWSTHDVVSAFGRAFLRSLPPQSVN